MIDHGQSSKFKKNKLGKETELRPKGEISKKKKFQGKCFKFDKVGHKSADCRLPEKKNNQEANVIDGIAQDVDVVEISLSSMVSEMNLVGSNSMEWWIDFDATRHVCSN